MVDLSVIIITLNNKKILESCLTSIKAHTRKISYEIIVSDNGSTDGSIEMLRSAFPDVCVIDNRKNLGFSAANNKGLKTANGRYCLILNDDTFIEEDAFSKMVEFMDNDATVAVTGPKLLNINGSIQRQGSIFSARTWSSSKPVSVGFVIGACMLIRTSILDGVGYFDENLFFYNDDLDLCKRVKKAGHKVVYYPAASVYHYGGFTSKKARNRFLETEGMRGGLYFCRKHYGPLAYQAYRTLILVHSLIMTLVSLITYPVNRENLAYYRGILAIAAKQELISKF